MMLGDVRQAVRSGMRWLDRQPGAVAVVQAGRRVIPGDGAFGDPMSTSGTSPAHALGRRVWMLSGGRWSLLAELALAGLQVADWLGEDVRGIAAREEMSILFVDLRGFSQWALRAGDEAAAELLRGVDAVTTEVFETNGGVVVKRLGDGAMTIFAECDSALDAAFEAIARVREVRVDGYVPALRAGLHAGRPQRIGNDFVGVDVNIAARLCEVAPAGEVVISDAVRERVGDLWGSAPLSDVRLRGVPADVCIFIAQRDGHASASPDRLDG
jgi:adenylate cyclase